MKLSLIFLVILTSSANFACQRPSNLREIYGGLKGFKELQKTEGISMFMFNYAIAWDDVEALKICFTNGDRIEYEDETLNQTDRRPNEIPISLKPLHLAAQYGSLQIIAFCLAHKAPVNSRTYCQDKEHHEQTPAHWAVIHGQHEALSALLKAGADPELKDAVGRTIRDLINKKEDITADNILQENMARKGKS